jgi:hypothetical protein
MIPRQFLWIAFLAVTCGCVIFLCVAVRTQQESTAGKEPSAAAASSDKRLPIAGSPGKWLLVRADNSSAIVDEQGNVTEINDSELVQNGKLLAVIGDKQVVVTPSGLVAVPKNAIVTFVGKDRVVTHRDNCESVVYTTDGKTQKHSRTR